MQLGNIKAADAPGDYLGWFGRKDFPDGLVGELLAVIHDLNYIVMGIQTARAVARGPSLRAVCSRTSVPVNKSIKIAHCRSATRTGATRCRE
jgi:hypothetical protein